MRSSKRYLVLVSCLFLLLGLTPTFAQSLGGSGGDPGDPGLVDDGFGGGSGGGPGDEEVIDGSGGGGIGGVGGGVLCNGGGLGPCCGDGICEPGENCLLDCAVCGDGVCSSNEDCSNCSLDCGGCPRCGDGICNGLETCANCSDCSTCFPAALQAFYRGNETENIYSITSQVGTSWSGNQTLNNSSKSPHAPGAAMLNDRMFLFHQGQTQRYVYFSWSDDGRIWSTNRKLGNGARTNSGVAAAAFNNRLYVFHKGRTGNDLWVSSSSDGMVWSSLDHKKITTGAQGLAGTPTPVVYDGRLHVYYINSVDRIRSVSTADGVTWTQGPILPGATGSGVGVAVFNDTLYMLLSKPIPGTVPGTIASEHRLHYRFLQNDGTWSQDFVIGDLRTTSRPSVVATDDRLVMLYKNAENANRVFYAYSFDGTNWTGGVPALGQTRNNGGPTLVYTD
ncbi:MAG: hypothetical protein AAGM22_17370 [Acidobacteriota bacterium]